MGASKNDKRKIGRPATGRDPVVAVRLPPHVIRGVDAYAKRNGITRSEALRTLVERALRD